MKEQAITKPYEPTPRERAVVETYFTRKKETPLAPRIKLAVKGGMSEISLDHPDPAIAQILLMEAMGTTNEDFARHLLKQLASVGSQGRTTDEEGLNFMLSVVKGIEPKDQVEAMLAAQMAAIHMATMTFSRRLAHVDNIQQQDSAERAYNKLARTFVAQMEALKRYRTGGEQKVTVKHVTVNEGGQAIVGNVTHAGGGGVAKTGEQAHALGYAPGTEMRCEDPKRDAVQVAGDAERTVPDARRKISGSPEGE